MKRYFGGKTALQVVGFLGLSITLTGCSLGTMELSGPAPIAQQVTVNLGGTVHGGQQPVSFSTIKLYAVGSGGYGSAANLLSTATSSTYYPGGTTGCSNTADTITAYAISGGVATFTATNTLITGQLVAISDASPLSGSTYIVTGRTASSFTVATANTGTVATTTETGTATPTCYSTVVTDYNGNFTITGDYSCGNFGSSDVYIVASGGNPGYASQSISNASLKLVTPIVGTGATTTVGTATGTGGVTCTNLSAVTSSVYINEITTAAAAYAMGQYFGSSNDSFSSASTTQSIAGLTNAVATVANLVNIYSGGAYGPLTLTGTAGNITATPETAKLVTVGNILASCVNSQGTVDTNNTSCATLFGATGASSAPTNTLEAAVDISLNPISGTSTNITSLYNLSNATGSAFPGGLSTQPTDWTLGIQYTSAAVLPQPLDLAADSNGNIWVISNPGGLTELSPTGSATFYSTTFGSSSTNISGSNPRNLALDTGNNVYVTTSSSPYNEVKYTPGTAATAATVLTFLSPLNKSPYGIAIDGNNDVFMGLQSGSTTVELAEFPASNFSLSNYITFPLAGSTPGTAGADGYIDPEYMAFDTAGNLWMTSGTGTNSIAAALELTNINTSTCSTFPCTLTTSTTANTYVASSGGSQGTPVGLAANSGGKMWVANAAANNNGVTAISDAGGTNNNTAGTATAYAPAGGFSSPHYLAVDGTGNVWVANKNTGTPPLGGTVSEITSGGTLLSETPISPSLSPNGFVHVGLNAGEGIAVDPSGNVWVANNLVTTGGVEELVGAAAPAVTPISLALKNNAVAAMP